MWKRNEEVVKRKTKKNKKKTERAPTCGVVQK
jgi:hypothetical protein